MYDDVLASYRERGGIHCIGFMMQAHKPLCIRECFLGAQVKPMHFACRTVVEKVTGQRGFQTNFLVKMSLFLNLDLKLNSSTFHCGNRGV